MANFDGFQAHPIDRFTGLYEQTDVANAPLGVLAVCRNNRFVVTECETRYGINQRLGNAWLGLNTQLGFPVTGANCFKYEGNGVLPDKQVPMIFDQSGNLFIESPPGSGSLVPITSTQVTPGAGNYMQSAQTLNRAFLAFTNIANPSVASSTLGVYDLLTGILDPLSMRPVGQTFGFKTAYQIGEVVTPILITAGGNGTGAGRSFRVSAITTGISGAVEPSWPGDGLSVVSAGVTFTENTLIFSNVVPPPDAIDVGGFPSIITNSPTSGLVLGAARVPAGAGFAAGRDVYVAATIINNVGETLPTDVRLAIQNTNLHDTVGVSVNSTVRTWLSGLNASFAPTGIQLYEADVATGAAAPDISVFHQVAGGPFGLAIGGIASIIATAGGVVPPVANTATIAAAGNVDTGPRWAGTLFVNRNGYISGFGAASVVENNLNVQGNQLFCQSIAIGPKNTKQRIVFFSEAGGTSVGPFAYIPSPDAFNGIAITATVINDNITTTGSFNFSDLYLEDLISTLDDVTNFFDKIQIPACRSVSYSETLDRMIYLAYELPSGAFISLPGDPETVLGSTGGIQVAETDGQNLMGIIDYKGIQYALKERSGHEVNPSADNPVNWTYTKRWDKVGPCGLRAFDSGLHFVIFAHRSGVYVFTGDEPRRLTKEIPVTWGRVNWAAGQTIWVKIDDDTREIHVGVPLDRATVPSHTLTLNFEEDVTLSPPIHSTVYSKGKFVSTAAARKWSVQEIAANSAVRTLRTVLNPPAQFDSATVQSQLWFASSFDGAVRAQTPGVYTDDGNTVNWTVETVCPGDALKVARLGGAQSLMTGQGAIGVTVLAGSVKAGVDGGVTNRQTEIKLKDAYVKPGMTTDYKCGASGVNERFRLRFSTTGKPPGTWGHICNASLFTNPLFQARPN